MPDKAFREEKEAQLRQELLAFERENTGYWTFLTPDNHPLTSHQLGNQNKHV